ncbi:uncharacterized protein [Dendrobates tinctorius]|uniref:uncharacterized protein n=1 Tax=Dendrobates tinctorius TaxID=92724 RepID=UPI003CC9E73C
MKVHVFGNSPSPAVAIYGLRRTVQESEREYGSDPRQFVEKNFYVDDGLKSLPTSEEAIDLLSRTQEMLSTSNLRLHKIISNSQEVMSTFPSEDHAMNLKDLNLVSDVPPTQRSHGLRWDIKQDTFTIQVSPCDKPFTKRGVLSVINSIYDPLGFVASITIQGKILLRQLTAENTDWDAPLLTQKQQRWETWKKSLKFLEQLQVPRCYSPMILTPATLLTQKIGAATVPLRNFDNKDIYKRQWKQVQHIANVFWHRWKTEYLHLLQNRHKWQTPSPNLQEGDLVLLKDKEAHRNDWPMGLITKVMPSEDGKTRKTEVKVTKGGSTQTFLCPVTDLVLLLPKEDVT